MKHRSEVDGLRALAVVPVILFHAGFDLFSGGFIGVDVFFVISGYLITTIIIEDIENNRFSIVKFYERRARRILPALFFVMLVCIPFAWMWMLPGQMKDFSQSLVAVSLFASNMLFWRESGYFSAAAEEKPLLHTWSLAVEEQYYVIFPIFLFLMWRFGKNGVFWMIVVFAAISLALSEWGWRNNTAANFYLAPTRAWELFSGSIAAFVVQRCGVKSNNLLSLIGLAAIVFSILAYDEATPFPSVYALVPVIGVVLLVIFADKATLAAKLLSTKGFVGVGLISYSAYLWHQPLFAFARIRSLSHPSLTLMAVLSFLSILLAYLSWRFVEKPFRKPSVTSLTTIVLTSSLGLALFLSIGLVGHFGKLSSGRFDVEEFVDWRDNSSCLVENGFSSESEKSSLIRNCLDRKDNFILLGDSHAQSISLALRKAIQENGWNLITLTANGCLPITGTSRLPLQEECIDDKAEYWKFIQSTNATVIISSRWRLNLIGPRFDNGEGGVEYGSSGLNYVVSNRDSNLMSHTLNFLQSSAEKNRLIILSQIPEAGWNVPEKAAKLEEFGSRDEMLDITTSYSVYAERNAEVIALMEKLERNENILVVRVEDLVCNRLGGGRCSNTVGGSSLYRDTDHPSPLLSEMIASSVMQSIADE